MQGRGFWNFRDQGNTRTKTGTAGRQALYAISVAAKLAGTGQQNIRLYETKGLLTPERTPGGTRQYSDADVALLLHIGELLDQGLNLAGIAKGFGARGSQCRSCVAPSDGPARVADK